jgi:glycosyltransferase involved in cell wall biosynthesis
MPGTPSILTIAAGMGLRPFAMDNGPAVHLRDLHRAFAFAGYRSEVLCAGSRRQRLEDPAGILFRGVGPPRGSILFAGLPDIQEWMYSRRFFAEGLRSARRLAPLFIYERDSLFNTGGVALARRLGLPHLLEVNAPLRRERRHYRRFRFERLAARCEDMVFRGTDAVVAVSGRLREYLLERGVPQEKIHVIPNGADTARFQNVAGPEEALKALGLPGDRILVGHVGTLKPWHGTDDLTECLVRCLQQNDRLDALIVGHGPGLSRLREKSAESGLAHRFTFTGAVVADRVPGLVAACRIMVALYPERDEAFYFSPLKVMEAMAAGRPVVASNLGQIAEVVRHEMDGLLVAPGDWKAAAEAVLTLAGDPERCRAMGRAAADRCHERFSWRAVACRIIDLAREAAAHG